MNLTLEALQNVPLTNDDNLTEQKSFDRRLLIVKEYLHELNPQQIKTITEPYILQNSKKFLKALNHNIGEPL